MVGDIVERLNRKANNREMKPKFSIIVPLYNKAPYVRKALESICAQTFRDFECIVVDDGSTDGSADVVRDFVKNDKMSRDKSLNEPLTLNDDRLTIISQPNAGVAAARNNGVAASNGEYVCFLDADDWWESDFLKVMAEAIKRCPNAGIYGVNYNLVRKGIVRKAVEGINTGKIDYFKEYYRPPYAMPLAVGSITISRLVYDEMGGFNSMLKMAEDFDLWTRIALKYPVYYIDSALAYYNQDVQVKWRAIGKLVDPKHHFVFHADYLLPAEEKNEYVRHTVDMVKIVCLRQYYLSRKYHQLAVDELKKIDVEQYSDASFASYLWQPLWKERLKHYLYTLIITLRNQ